LSTPFRLEVPAPVVEEMTARAKAALPNECCGLLAGYIERQRDAAPVGRVVRSYALTNAAASPVEYLSEPREMFEAIRDMRRRGTDILAVYHSHPDADPVPSRNDLDRNYSTDVVNIIISLKDGAPRLEAWWLWDAGYRPADWRTVEN
jgi:proteasome lid subunit RPN8/RPN11